MRQIDKHIYKQTAGKKTLSKTITEFNQNKGNEHLEPMRTQSENMQTAQE